MAGIPLYFGTDTGSHMPTVRMSCFIKVNTLLTHDTAIIDIDAGVLGYSRLSWSAEAFFTLEHSYRGSAATLYLCPGGWTPLVNQWYWVSAICGGDGNGAGTFDLYGQVYGPGTPPGLQHHAVTGATAGYDTPACGLGWGVPLSSGYNPFPNHTGDVLTELCIETENGTFAHDLGPLAVPSVPIVAPSSPTTHGIVALYHCNEPLSAGVTVHDATPNHYDLTPGPNNDLILADSPFG